MNGWIKLFTLVLAASMASCGGGGGAAADNPPADKPAAAVQDTVGTLYGKVLDNDSGAGLAGATVTAGGKTTTTGPDGSYLFENLALGRWVVVASAPGHAEQVAVAHLNGYQGRQQLVLRALAVGSVHSFDASLPQTLIDTASAARVTLPAAALVRADGSSPVGAVRAEITRIDPGVDPTDMPGDYATASGPLQSYGAVTVTFRDAAGLTLNLAAGKTATLRIPLASALASPPATSPLWYLDTRSGLWVREGEATRVGTGAGAYYEGVVSHFSTWNADDLLNTVLVTGRLTDENGLPLAGVTVIVVGVDYSGYATAVTDANGNFSVPMKSGATAQVVAVLNGVESATQRVTSTTSNVALGSALVLPSAAGSRVMLGAPRSVEDLSVTPNDCCRFFKVQIPFSTNGLQLLRLQGQGDYVQARWELRHVFEQARATPEIVCWTDFAAAPGGAYVCRSDGGAPTTYAAALTTPYIVPWNRVEGAGTGFTATRIDAGTSATSGTLEYVISVHDGRFAANITPASVTFTAVLAVDLRDALTGRTVTVRSEARSITIDLRKPGP